MEDCIYESKNYKVFKVKIYISEIQFINKYSKQTVMMTNLVSLKKINKYK